MYSQVHTLLHLLFTLNLTLILLQTLHCCSEVLEYLTDEITSSVIVGKASDEQVSTSVSACLCSCDIFLWYCEDHVTIRRLLISQHALKLKIGRQPSETIEGDTHTSTHNLTTEMSLVGCG